VIVFTELEFKIKSSRVERGYRKALRQLVLVAGHRKSALRRGCSMEQDFVRRRSDPNGNLHYERLVLNSDTMVISLWAEFENRVHDVKHHWVGV